MLSKLMVEPPLPILAVKSYRIFSLYQYIQYKYLTFIVIFTTQFLLISFTIFILMILLYIGVCVLCEEKYADKYTRVYVIFLQQHF